MNRILETIPNTMNTAAINSNITALRECVDGAKAVSFLFLSTKACIDLIWLSQASLQARPTPLSLAHCEQTPRKQNLQVPAASFCG